MKCVQNNIRSIDGVFGWLAMKDRLSTRARMIIWDSQGIVHAVPAEWLQRESPVLWMLFYKNILEEHYGVLIGEWYSSQIGWFIKLQHRIFLWGKRYRASLWKVAWWATVYHLWIQRNCRIHGREVKTEEQIVKSITRDVEAKVEAKSNLDNSIFNKVLCINWGILGSALELIEVGGARSVYKRFLEDGCCFSSFETGLVSLVLNWWLMSCLKRIWLVLLGVSVFLFFQF